MRNKLPIALSLAALVVALLGTVPVAQSHGVFHAIFAHRAGAVDGKSAVGAGATLNRAAGKLVATKARGTDRGKFLKKFIPKVDSAVNADNAATAANADMLDGQDSSAFVSHARFAQSGTNILDWDGTLQTVQSLDLPAGRWVVISKVLANSNAAGNPTVDCQLSAGTTVIDDGFDIGKVGDAAVDDREYFTYFGTVELAAAATVNLQCAAPAATAGNWLNRRIVAMQVGSFG